MALFHWWLWNAATNPGIYIAMLSGALVWLAFSSVKRAMLFNTRPAAFFWATSLWCWSPHPGFSKPCPPRKMPCCFFWDLFNWVWASCFYLWPKIHYSHWRCLDLIAGATCLIPLGNDRIRRSSRTAANGGRAHHYWCPGASSALFAKTKNKSINLSLGLYLEISKIACASFSVNNWSRVVFGLFPYTHLSSDNQCNCPSVRELPLAYQRIRRWIDVLIYLITLVS